MRKHVFIFFTRITTVAIDILFTRPIVNLCTSIKCLLGFTSIDLIDAHVRDVTYDNRQIVANKG